MIDRLKIKTTKTKNGTKKDLFKNQLEIKDKINEIIKEVSKIKSSLGDVIDVQMQKEDHLNFTDLPSKHEHPDKTKFRTVNKKYDMSKYEVENGVTRLKKDWKSTLEEARGCNLNLQRDGLDMEMSIVETEKIYKKINLYEQLIDQIIKENEENKNKLRNAIDDYNDLAIVVEKNRECYDKLQQENEEKEKQLQWIKNNICCCSEQNCVLDIANYCEECIKKNILKLQQQKPIDEDIIKSIIEKEYGCDEVSELVTDKIIKYFKEIKWTK